MANNNNLTQSTTRVLIIQRPEAYVVSVRNADIDGITADIRAEFSRYDKALTWANTFGIGYDSIRYSRAAESPRN